MSDEETITKILVVDDEQDIVEVLSYLFKRSGYAPVQATNGRDAIEAVRAGGVSLVVLDYMLPDMNGLEVMRELKILQPDIKVIMITGRATDKVLAGAVEAGANGYVIKPFINDRLMELIRETLAA
jgi:CheY-like chemotaxis protein